MSGEVGVLTTGHTGKAACVIEAIQSLAGIICPVHAFPTLHTGSCQHNGRKKNNTDTNMHLVESNRSAPLRTLFTAYSKRMCLKSNSTQSVNTCKSSRSHHGGDFHTVKTQLLMPACLLFHSSVFAEALLLKGNSAGSDLFFSFSFFGSRSRK